MRRHHRTLCFNYPFRMLTTYTEAPQLFTLRNSSGIDYFQMVGDELQVKKKLRKGIFNVTMRVDAGSAFAEHDATLIVMTERDKYPVFGQLNYELQVRFPSTVKSNTNFQL